MSIIVANCQHCDEQQFQTLACVHYVNFSVVKLDLFIRAPILDRILVLEKTTSTSRVHLVNANDTIHITKSLTNLSILHSEENMCTIHWVKVV